jgi:hypothetical protein
VWRLSDKEPGWQNDVVPPLPGAMEDGIVPHSDGWPDFPGLTGLCIGRWRTSGSVIGSPRRRRRDGRRGCLSEEARAYASWCFGVLGKQPPVQMLGLPPLPSSSRKHTPPPLNTAISKPWIMSNMLAHEFSCFVLVLWGTARMPTLFGLGHISKRSRHAQPIFQSVSTN